MPQSMAKIKRKKDKGELMVNMGESKVPFLIIMLVLM